MSKPSAANRAKLALQRLALSAYYPGEYKMNKLTRHRVEQGGVFKGDTLPLFIWREVGDAEGDPHEAIEMLHTAIGELERVIKRIHQSTQKAGAR